MGHWTLRRQAFVPLEAGASLVGLIAPRPSERVLNLGCGAGRMTARVAQAGADVVGIDASAEMVEQARRCAVNSSSWLPPWLGCWRLPTQATLSGGAMSKMAEARTERVRPPEV
jgi:hypothetical protein